MRRVVSVWLPHWQMEGQEWCERSAGIPAFAAEVRCAVSGMSDGPSWRHRTAKSEASAFPSLYRQDSQFYESAGLERLASWCRRYTPWTAVEAPDGISLDVTGVCHPAGGEGLLLDDLEVRLAAFGLTARAAIASTMGAARALARHGEMDRQIVPGGEESRFLAPLPIHALSLDGGEGANMVRLGIRTVGQLMQSPGELGGLTASPHVQQRLEEALGIRAETACPHQPETLYAGRLTFPEPVASIESLTHVAELLAHQVTGQLRREGKGAKLYTLTLYRTCGGTVEASAVLDQAGHKPVHVLRAFREKFACLGRTGEVLAFDAATLYATRVEPFVNLQASQTDEESSFVEQQERLSNLIDCLVARLGIGAASRFGIPENPNVERASLDLPVLRKASSHPHLARHRPLLALQRAEPLRVLAAVPDCAPRRFTWRGLDYRVVKADGPERVGPEWWQTTDSDAAPRDYYAVEDESGRCFWLYREGQYQDAAMPRWFLQGMFA
jgi:protein ImuB